MFFRSMSVISAQLAMRETVPSLWTTRGPRWSSLTPSPLTSILVLLPPASPAALSLGGGAGSACGWASPACCWCCCWCCSGSGCCCSWAVSGGGPLSLAAEQGVASCASCALRGLGGVLDGGAGFLSSFGMPDCCSRPLSLADADADAGAGAGGWEELAAMVVVVVVVRLRAGDVDIEAVGWPMLLVFGR